MLRRVVFSAPERAAVETLSDTGTLEANEALLRTTWSLISTGTEVAVYTNINQLGRFSVSQYPHYPGYAAAGVIEQVGNAIKTLTAGNRVMAAVGHASHARFRPDRALYTRLPDDFRDDFAPFIRLALVSLATLRQADIRAGEWLGVVGLGLVGNLGAQFGRCAGFRVISIGRSELRNRIAEQCGIEPVLTGTVAEIEDAVQSLTGGTRCRFVLETTGTPQGLQKAIAMAADGATIALVGVPWQHDSSVAATEIMQPAFLRYLSITGGWEWGIPLFAHETERPTPMIPHRHSTEANAAYAADCIQRGIVRIEPLITHRISPDEVQSAYQGLLRRKNEYLGVLLKWQ